MASELRQRLLDARRAIDVDGIISDGGLIRYIGIAELQPNGKWTCLADVGGEFCRVEVSITGALTGKSVEPGDG
jgi:hypothetical protein